MNIKHGDILKRTHTNIKDGKSYVDYFIVEEEKSGFTLFLCDKEGSIFNKDREDYSNKHHGVGHSFIQDEEWKWEVI